VRFAAIEQFWKFWRLSLRDRLLLLEAFICLAIAGVAIAALPFRYVGVLAALPLCRAKPPHQARSIKVRRVRWAIVTIAGRVPWHALCFQQGLAAQFMLRRRGVPSVLYYGAALDNQSGLLAHVWVRDADVDVIGGQIASRFAVLTTFPSQEKSSL
jgi:hypothetical protein